MGLSEWATVLDEAMQFFGKPYPRERADRLDRLAEFSRPKGGTRQEWDPFYDLDEQFYKFWDCWEETANLYARSKTPPPER